MSYEKSRGKEADFGSPRLCLIEARVIKRLPKAGIWLPVAQDNYSGLFFVFLIICALFFFGGIIESEPITSCLFSGVRLQESRGEASKASGCF